MLNQFKQYIQKIGQFLNKHPFVLIHCLFLILMVYAGWLAYIYILYPRATPIEATAQNQIEETSYQEIIQILDQKAENLANPPAREYRDIFR